MLMRNLFILILYSSINSTSLAQSTFNFDDFSDISILQLNGSTKTTTTTDGMVLRLTPAIEEKQAGSVFTQLPVNTTQFSTFFTMRLTESGGTQSNSGYQETSYDDSIGGQGLVFVIQSAKPDWLDLKDYWDNDWQLYEPSGLGYHYLSYSVGVEFDTWGDVFKDDPNSNHIAIVGERTNAHSYLPNFAIAAITPDFNDGNLWYTWVDYNGTTLEVRTSQTCQRPATPTLSQEIDMPTILGGKNVGEEWVERINEGFVGFTATTSPEGFNNQDIINWSYRDTFAPIESPQLEVWDNTTQITRGATVDIGTTPANTPISKTFTIKNSGDLSLHLNPPTLPAHFSWKDNYFPNLIPPKSTVPVTLQFNAPEVGTVTGTLQFSSNACNENDFNFVINSTATAPINTPPPVTEQQTCFEQHNGLLNQAQCIPADVTTTMTSTGIATDAQIKAGISQYVNGIPSFFQRSDAVTLADPIVTAGVIKVDSQDIGKKASIIAAGIYISSLYPQGFRWYLLSDCPNCPQGWMLTELPYNETTALPLLTQPMILPLQTVDNLPEYYTVELYAGNLPMPGFLNIFLGYRLEEGHGQGKVVFNMTPISITIIQPLTPQ